MKKNRTGIANRTGKNVSFIMCSERKLAASSVFVLTACSSCGISFGELDLLSGGPLHGVFERDGDLALGGDLPHPRLSPSRRWLILIGNQQKQRRSIDGFG